MEHDLSLAEAENQLGDMLEAMGRIDEALLAYQRAILLHPDFLEAHVNVGNAHFAQARYDQAEAAFRRAAAIRPGDAVVHNNLAAALQRQDRLEDAEAEYRRALELNSDYKEAANNLGTLLHARGRLHEALQVLEEALSANADDAQLLNNLGNALQAAGRTADAERAYRRAIASQPTFSEAYNNLGGALHVQKRLGDAERVFQRALELRPDSAVPLMGFANVLVAQGRVEEAAAHYGQALKLRPNFAAAHSASLLCDQYRDGVTLAGLARAHAEWDERHAAPLRKGWRPHTNDRNPYRPLRLGFVSADLGRHPVGYFLASTLEALRRHDCQTVCYSDRTELDAMGKRIQSAVDEWRDAQSLSDEALAERIRADRIDILFDLAGHTGRGRLLAFARKPAPLQATWIGYVGTTGLAAMDYLIADQHHVPPAAEAHYREQVLRLPHGYVCFTPPDDAPPVSPPPTLTKGCVTFGSFNNPAKFSPRVLDAWSAILRRVAGSRLVLAYVGLDEPATRERLRTAFSNHGVARERVELLPWRPPQELLATYGEIDVALDTFPYSGGLTTCEALWMGVPVVTCPGETFAGRHSLSHLSNVGLTECVAGNTDQYIELAVELAGDLSRLAKLRESLRERMRRSPLCDADRFAVDLMEMLRSAWRQWTSES